MFPIHTAFELPRILEELRPPDSISRGGGVGSFPGHPVIRPSRLCIWLWAFRSILSRRILKEALHLSIITCRFTRTRHALYIGGRRLSVYSHRDSSRSPLIPVPSSRDLMSSDSRRIQSFSHSFRYLQSSGYPRTMVSHSTNRPAFPSPQPSHCRTGLNLMWWLPI